MKEGENTFTENYATCLKDQCLALGGFTIYGAKQWGKRSRSVASMAHVKEPPIVQLHTSHFTPLGLPREDTVILTLTVPIPLGTTC